jgi:hypothetical protein
VAVVLGAVIGLVCRARHPVPGVDQVEPDAVDARPLMPPGGLP